MANRHAVATLVGLVVLMAGASLSADRLRLRSGKAVEGMVIGSDSTSVRILLANGTRSEFPIGDIASIEFDTRAPSPRTVPPPTAPPPSPKAAPAAVLVPEGTILTVRVTESIDVDVARAGSTFKSIVDDPVMVNGRPVIPRGSSALLQAVQVQQSGTMKGSDKITLKASSVSFGGRAYPMATSYVEAKGGGEGKKTARKIGGGVGLGAVIGGVAGGGDGAAVGALVGGLTGAAVASAGEEHLKVPAETRLQFRLTAALRIQP